jgi:multiple antibiotic resistance protein
MNDFWLCFVPLFVAVDAIGVLPIFVSLTQDIDAKTIRRIIIQSVVTAMAVALVFLVAGTALLRMLGITVADFMVAGGVLLFIISISDILTGQKAQRRVDPDALGAVPIGVPLITGPAVLTTSILLMNQHGFNPTAASIVVNILIAGVIFHFTPSIYRFLGKAGTKTLSKVADLLLAAIAVMIIRRGIISIIATYGTDHG